MSCDTYLHDLVQVRYPNTPKIYTYIAPHDWHVRVGDEVRSQRDGGYGDWARVVGLGPGSHKGPFRELADHRRGEPVTVTVPRDVARNFLDFAHGPAGAAVASLIRRALEDDCQ